MQPTVQLFHDQHSRALKCAGEISAILGSPDDVKGRANDIRLLLAQLAGVLKPHFLSEDRLLYPTLMSSSDPRTSEIATRFWKEMGGITQAVAAFLDNWRKPGEIERESEKFASECRSIFTALKARIDAEEKELYPIFLQEG